MRIAFLSRYQGSVNRGVETVVTELSARLARQHKVVIFAGAQSDNMKNVTGGEFDIVIPMNGRMQSFNTCLNRWRGRYKVVILGESGIGRDEIWNIAAARPDVFVALTDYMAKWAKKWAWGSRVVKIPNGVDVQKFSPQGMKLELGLPFPVVLSVGALTWYKHHEKTIEAMSRLGSGSLLIVGSGPEEEKLRELGKRKVGSNFRLVNFNYESMPQVYRSANVFTLPSWDREAFGVVYLEAMASNLPVVAPDDFARQEIVGGAGILTNVDDPVIFAGALRSAVDKQWGNLPLRQAAKFSWDKIAAEYASCFENLLENSKRK